MPCLNIVTRCEYLSGTASPKEPEEVAAVRWLSTDEIFDHDAAPEFLERDIERLETHRQTS